MRIKHHYFLEKKRKLQIFLEKNHIRYEICPSTDTKLVWCVFDLYEDEEAFRRFKILFPFSFSITVEVEYSIEEIEAAEWLTVRSLNTKIKREFDEKTFQFSCPFGNPCRELKYRHIEQVGPFLTKKKVNWKANQFFCGTDGTGENYIFCAEKTKALISDLWEGLDFWPVKKYSTKQKIEDVYQLHFKQVLPFEAVVLTGKEKISTCKLCGKKKLYINERYQLLLNKQYMEKKNYKNVYKTEDIWTYDKVGWHTFSLNIVSHDFYQFCKNNRIDRGLVYEPIKLV